MRLSVFLTLLAVTFLAGCLPVTSKVPAGTTIGFSPDSQLLGTWRAKSTDEDESQPAFIHFLGKDDGTMVAILVSPPHGENLGEWDLYELHAATLGANHVLSAREVSHNGTASTDELAAQYILLAWRKEGAGRLTLYVMDDKATAAAIKSGEVAGAVEPGQDGDVHITADSQALDKFLASPKAAALFNKPLVELTRIE